MCGIAGFVDSTTVDREAVVARMTDRIVHRGPDDEGMFVNDHVALGFRRLSIIDLHGGHQPIPNEDESMWITFNGEIYNFEPLREELKAAGHEFRTDADTEVIVHGYEQWGADVVHRLRGMFAFVIWDNTTRTLFGARDPFGIKPLYYQANDQTFLYASEIKAFLGHPHFVKKVNTDVLADYLSFEYVPGEDTLFAGVKKLLAGHYFTYSDGVLTLERYFDPKFLPTMGRELEEWKESVKAAVSDSVNAHRIADVEVGCFLSSGIDSSYIAHEFSQLNPNVRAFSVGYEEEEFSELSYARAFAEHEGIEFSSRVLGARETFDAVGTIQYYMDEPLPNPSALPLFFLAEYAARHVKVVMSGEGADELFGGYNQYREPLDYALYQKIPAPIRRAIARGASHMPPMPGRRFLRRAALSLRERYFRHEYVFSEGERLKVLRAGSPAAAAAVPPLERTRAIFDSVVDADDITQMQYADILLWMMHDINLKADKMSMAQSLELRVPFLDTTVFSVARRIPSHLRVSRKNTKLSLRAAAQDLIPKATAEKKKLGFPLPLNQWLREEPFVSQVRSMFASDAASEFFDKSYIMSLLDAHMTSDGYMKRIWSIYCFLVWHQEFFVKR